MKVMHKNLEDGNRAGGNSFFVGFVFGIYKFFRYSKCKLHLLAFGQRLQIVPKLQINHQIRCRLIPYS